MGSQNGVGSGADSVGSWNGAGSVGSRNGADSGADSVGSRSGAGSGADRVELVVFFLLNLHFSVGVRGPGQVEKSLRKGSE